MKIPTFHSIKIQQVTLGRHKWSVARLIELSKNLPVLEIPLDHLNVNNIYNRLTLREMVMHMDAVKAADLAFPIILDEDGDILDGRHRIMKAMLLRKKTIKAVRFDENPEPCEIIED
jgi:hypothetical protein